MPDSEKQTKPADRPKTRKAPKPKTRLSTRVFNLILEYKESRLFQWVNRHYMLSMLLVALWGMVIIIMFLWFVIANVVKTSGVR